MAHCNSCNAAILWIKNLTTGGTMPLDATPTTSGNIRITDSRRSVGKVLTNPDLATARSKGELLHTSHFATCPNAKAHRKSARPTGVAPSTKAAPPPVAEGRPVTEPPRGARTPSGRPTERPTARRRPKPLERKPARKLERVFFVVVGHLEHDRCTVLGCFTSRAEADELLDKGGDAVAVYDARARLAPGTRAWHAGGVAWTFNAAGEP